MHGDAKTLNHRTPNLRAEDPRGLLIRSVDYYRASGQNLYAKTTTHRYAHDVKGMLCAIWDPRMLARAGEEGFLPNTRNISSLSGISLRSDNVDAGWQAYLFGTAFQRMYSWNGRHGRSRLSYDASSRLVTIHERFDNAPEYCAERRTYAAPDSDAIRHNRSGRLIRHDDPGGSLHIDDYDLHGARIRHARYYLKNIDIPDWPESVTDRDAMVEEMSWATTWKQNATGEQITFTDASGNRRRYRYDVTGRFLASWLQIEGEDSERPVVTECRYDAHGHGCDKLQDGMTIVSTYTQGDQRLCRIQGLRQHDNAVLMDLNYDYDAAGNVTTASDFTRDPVSATNTYDYDSLYRLTAATGFEEVQASVDSPEAGTPAKTGHVAYRETYDYDDSGNLIETRHEGAFSRTERLTVSPFGNRAVPQSGSETPDIDDAFDESGNLLELAPGRALRWNLRNQLSGTSLPSDASEHQVCETYVYDAAGLRIRKALTTHKSEQTHIRDVRYLPGLELRHDSASGERLQVIDAGAGSVRCLRWEGTPPDGMQNPAFRRVLSDHLGSHTLELDGDASPISSELYHPYGTTASFNTRSAIEAEYKTHRYSGKERDASGLYYYGFRYYAPHLRRWINPDPAGDMAGINRFTMVRDNPTSRRDALGLIDIQDLASLAGSSTARELVSSALGGVVGYAVMYALEQIPANRQLNDMMTGLGAVAGGSTGALVGAGLLGSFAANDGSEWGTRVTYQTMGAAGGFALGSSPTWIGSLQQAASDDPNPGINYEASRQIADLASAITKEVVSQALSKMTAQIKWKGNQPSGAGLSWTALSDSIVAGVGGALKHSLPSWVSTFISSPAQSALQAGLATTIRSTRLDNDTEVSTSGVTGRPQIPDPKSTMIGASIRNLSGTAYNLVAITTASILPDTSRDVVNNSITAASLITPKILRSVADAVLGKIPDSYRSYFADRVTRGLVPPQSLRNSGINADPTTLQGYASRRSSAPDIELGPLTQRDNRQGEEKVTTLRRRTVGPIVPEPPQLPIDLNTNSNVELRYRILSRPRQHEGTLDQIRRNRRLLQPERFFWPGY